MNNKLAKVLDKVLPKVKLHFYLYLKSFFSENDLYFMMIFLLTNILFAVSLNYYKLFREFFSLKMRKLNETRVSWKTNTMFF
jgi:hypothetical protein